MKNAFLAIFYPLKIYFWKHGYIESLNKVCVLLNIAGTQNRFPGQNSMKNAFLAIFYPLKIYFWKHGYIESLIIMEDNQLKNL